MLYTFASLTYSSSQEVTAAWLPFQLPPRGPGKVGGDGPSAHVEDPPGVAAIWRVSIK